MPSSTLSTCGSEILVGLQAVAFSQISPRKERKNERTNEWKKEKKKKRYLEHPSGHRSFQIGAAIHLATITTTTATIVLISAATAP
jgi:hypothetical protein